ncbi:MAG: hypothetical protein ACERLB_03270 [Gammaproteobacteria bacterium]
MEQIINYLAFMVVIVIVTIFLFELPGSNRTVEKSGKTHILQAEPGQGYWDYLLVAGMGILLLLEIFLINI